MRVSAVAPQLVSIYPAGGQRGSEVPIEFKGERLQDSEEIICYEPGIQVLKLDSVTNSVVKARLKIAADCALGEHHLRVRSASGISELRTFQVVPFPIVEETEPNDDPSHAMKIALNSTVAGTVKSEDVDCFAVDLKQGQRFSAEVQGIRLGRANFDPRLTVLDQVKTVVADADDTWLGMQDPFVSFVAPSNGTYVVQLREATYGGNDNCNYLLHLGSFARPDAVYPLGGPAGQTVAFTFFSEATGLFTNQIKLPGSAQEKFGAFAELDGLSAPSPNWVRVSTFTNVLSSGTNHDREHAKVADFALPLALNGIIAKPGQEEWFRFPAVKGVALEVKTYARRLRSPLDSIIEIQDSKGQTVASDDDAGGVDSLVKFTPPESTNYFLRIRDTLGHGGPDFCYRVEIDPPAPSIGVKIPEVARNDTQSRQYISVPRGNRFATLLSAKRANLDSELDLSIEGLPAGLTMQAERLIAKVDSEPVVFEATTNAALAGKLVNLTATGTNSQGKVTGNFHHEIELVQGPPNNANYFSTSVDKLCVAVTKEVPYQLRIVEPKVPLVQGGTMRLEVIADRATNFDEPIELQMVWNPPGVTSQSEATIPKGATNVFYQLNAGGGAETHSWKIAILGHATVEGGQAYVSTQLARLEVASPFLTGKMETLWINPGKTGKLSVNLEQLKPFEGNAVIRLMGLPEKVTAAEKQITSTNQEVVFDVAVDDKCSTGSHKNLFCTVDVKQNGETIPHTLGNGGILRIVPPKKEDTKVAANTPTKP